MAANCSYCDKQVGDDDEAFCCLKCHSWVHVACLPPSARISKQTYKLLAGSDFFHFICQSCQLSTPAASPHADDQILPRMISVLERLEARLAARDSVLESIVERVSRLETHLAPKSESDVGAIVREQIERHEKRNNCVIVGLQESPASTLDDMIKSMAEQANIPLSAVVDYFRDGRSMGPDRPRITKVKFHKFSDKLSFLKQSKRFKELGGPFRNCFVRNDMTYQERMKDRELRMELSQMDDDFRKSHMIRNFKIVNRPGYRLPVSGNGL